jgi:hypothetical protein
MLARILQLMFPGNCLLMHRVFKLPGALKRPVYLHNYDGAAAEICAGVQ